MSADATCALAAGAVRSRRAWPRVLAWLVVCAAATGAGYLVGFTTILNPTRSGSLDVDSAHLDFGRVWVQDSLAWKLPIRNTSSRVVDVLDIKTSCGCTVPAETSFTIPAGATHDLPLKLNLTTRDPHEAALASRDFAVQIVPIVKEGLAYYAGWTLKGTVESPLHCTPAMLDIPSGSLVWGSAYPAKTVEVEAHQPLSALSAECPPEFARVNVTPRGTDGRRFELQVAINEQLQAGDRELHVLLRPTLRDGRRAPEIPFSVTCRVVFDVMSMPATVAFGAVPAGIPVSETVVLQSRSGKAFAAAPVADSTQPLHIEQRSPDRFKLTLASDKPGAQRAQARLRIEPASGAPYELSVPVLWHGMSEKSSVTAVAPAGRATLQQGTP